MRITPFVDIAWEDAGGVDAWVGLKGKLTLEREGVGTCLRSEAGRAEMVSVFETPLFF